MVNKLFHHSHGVHELTLMSLLSLEVAMGPQELKLLQQKDRLFRKGWLQDEVVGSFMHDLCRGSDRIIYCGATEALAISRWRSANLLWANKDLEQTEIAFVPFNPSGSHWILLVLHVKDSSAVIIDPIKDSSSPEDYPDAIHIVRQLFAKFNQQKFSFSPTPTHTLQQDSYNCGVMICFYAEMIATGKPLSGEFSPDEFRKYILERLLGKCLEDFQGNYRSCKLCKDPSGDEWVQCNRCPQWFHCWCADVSVDDADANKDYFVCPL